MSVHAIAAFNRRITAAVSRRNSLLALGGTSLTAALARLPTATAADCDHRVRKVFRKCDKKRERRCLRQRTQCVAAANAFCQGNLGCIAATRPCCNLFDRHCGLFSNAPLECLMSLPKGVRDPVTPPPNPQPGN